MKLKKRVKIETPGGNQEKAMVQDEVRFKFKKIFLEQSPSHLTVVSVWMAVSPSRARLWLMNSKISSVMDRVGGGLRGVSSSSSSSSSSEQKTPSVLNKSFK